jgi:hypothetical protein
MTNNNEGLKVVFAEVQNFKGVTHQVLELDGKSAWLIGGNGKGKSSLIDALLSTVDSQYIPSQPIKDGEDRGVINIKLAGTNNGKDEEYEISITFTPSMRTGRVKLKHNGQEITRAPKDMLKSIFGKISFDIYEFISSPKKEQVKTLKVLTGAEEKLNSIDFTIQSEREEYRRISKNLEDSKAVNKRENRPFNDDDIIKYGSSTVDENAVMMELSSIEAESKKWNDNYNKVMVVKNEYENNKNSALRSEQAMEDISRQMQELEAKLKIHEKQHDESLMKMNESKDKLERGEAWLQRNPKPSSEAVLAKLSEAKKHNQMHSIISEYKKRQDNILSMQAAVDEMKDKISKLEKSKVDIIANSQLPVAGLSFTDDDITLNGIPLDQVNTATKLDIAVSVSMAMNKKLKLVMIREGSLFDIPHLKDVLYRLHDAGFQYIVEWVDPEGGELEIKYEEVPFENTK